MDTNQRVEQESIPDRAVASKPAPSQMDELEMLEKLESSAGIISLIRFDIGYKDFVSGLSPADSFFPFTPGDDVAQAKALEVAKKLLEEHGATTRAQIVAQFTAFKLKVKGRDVTQWRDDRVFAYPLWTRAYKEIVKPAMKEVGLKQTGEFWGRLSFREDPSGRTETDQNGEERVALVAFPAEIYASESEARTAAGVADTNRNNARAGSGANGADGWDEALLVPRGWSRKSWANIVPTLVSEKKNGKTSEQIAADYDLPLECVSQAVD